MSCANTKYRVRKKVGLKPTATALATTPIATPARSDDTLRLIVRNEMVARGLPVAHVARDAGMHRVSLQNWLSGKRGIRSDKLARVMDLLGIEARARAPRTAEKRTGARP